jgi:prepilin-type N-terminal cleavage/methylation domain-containing protein
MFDTAPLSCTEPLRFYFRHSPCQHSPRQRGFSLTEVLVALAVSGTLTAIAAPIIKFGTNPLKDSSSRLAGSLKLLRAKAVSQTSAYRLRAVPGDSMPSLQVERATLCSDSVWTADPSFTAEDTALDRSVQLTQVVINGQPKPVDGWSICYSSRGLATQNAVLTLSAGQRAQTITVFPGGAVDVQTLP